MLDNYRRRKLDPTQGYKPLDFGGGGITGSINRDGRITAINTYHPEHGYVTLASAPPFDESQRYNPSAVRAYRKSLVDLAGYGLKFFDVPIVSYEAFLIEDAIPHLKLTLENGVTAEVITFISTPTDGKATIFHWWQFSEYEELAYFSGKIWLQRCAYTQLTEGGPIPMPPVETKVIFQRKLGFIQVQNKLLDVTAALIGYGCIDNPDGSVEFQKDGMHFPNPGDEWGGGNGHKEYLFTFGIGHGEYKAEENQLAIWSYGSEYLIKITFDIWQARWQGWQYDNHPLDLSLRRALVYALHCCIPVDENSICLITDHQLLPLAWTRDAYYTIMPLLRWRPEFHETVKKHLHWLFEVAQRPNGYWGRAYLTNGRVKDNSFQLDQQLYPLLELAEYIETTGDSATWEKFQPHVEKIMGMLLDKIGNAGLQPSAADTALKDGVEGYALFPTDETPADDPVHLPYHLSSHILFWHTLQKLSPLTGGKWDSLAEQIRQAVYEKFVAMPSPKEGEGEKIFAYLTNGAGQHHFYHDANDLPLALAPHWGFCTADDPIWLATMNFAFSENNAGGFYGTAADEFRGLGSVHTPSAWPLGDVQEILFAQAIGDADRKNRVVAKLAKVAQWDGALPEAYHVQTGEVVSRHWFAWPNAALHLIEWEKTA